MARRIKQKPTNPAGEAIKTDVEPHVPQGYHKRGGQNSK